MDETSLHTLLDSAIGGEPPIGPVARNSLREGIKLRRRARLRRAAGTAAVVTAAAACIPAFTGIAGNRAAAPSAATAYIANYSSGTVTPINLATNTPGKPIPVGGSPAAIAITPDGKTAYVANSSSGTVTPINLATNTPGKPIRVGRSPVWIAITPDGKTAYVET
jgi:YVTN family beta-propeller protein